MFFKSFPDWHALLPAVRLDEYHIKNEDLLGVFSSTVVLAWKAPFPVA